MSFYISAPLAGIQSERSRDKNDSICMKDCGDVNDYAYVEGSESSNGSTGSDSDWSEAECLSANQTQCEVNLASVRVVSHQNSFRGARFDAEREGDNTPNDVDDNANDVDDDANASVVEEQMSYNPVDILTLGMLP